MGKSKEKKKILDAQETQYEEEHVDEDDVPQDVVKTTKKKKKKEKITVKIETLSENPEKISPIIGYFPSQYDPLNKSSGNADLGAEESTPEVKVYKNAKRSNRYQVVVSPNSSRVEFVGTNYSGEATAPQLCTYALGVLDKSTQTLKVVPITANKIFRLEPRVGGVDQPEDEPQESAKSELTEEQKDEEKRKSNMYLAKKTIREIKKRELLHQHDDPETQKDIDMTIQGLKINEEALEVASTATNSSSIPPHDIDATAPSRAYPLEKIIFRGEWDYLLDIFELLQVGGEVAADIYPSFVRNRVYKLDDIKDEVEKKRLAGILSYITHLIKFKDKHSMETISSAKHHKIPGILFQKFSSMFADSGLKTLPDDKRNLLISYVLVLTLFVDDFRTDPSDIASDLRMNPVTLRQHFEILGCKFVRQKQLLATLPVPLHFSSVRRRKRKTQRI